MARNLTQKTFNRSLDSSIHDAGLIQKIVTRTGESEYHFPYEEITTNKVAFQEDNTTILAIAVAFAAMSGLGLFITFTEGVPYPWANALVIIPTILVAVLYFKTKKRKIHLYTTKNRAIEFPFDANRREEVIEFIDELINERNKYLFEKYGQPTRNLEYAPQLDNLNWLLNSRAITKAQYDEKLQQLNSLFNTSSAGKTIGFATNS